MLSEIADRLEAIPPKGTLVRWVNCDRLILKRAKTLVPHIEEPLGRIFRYFINDHSLEITIKVFQNNDAGLFQEVRTLEKKIKPMETMAKAKLKAE